MLDYLGWHAADGAYYGAIKKLCSLSNCTTGVRVQHSPQPLGMKLLNKNHDGTMTLLTRAPELSAAQPTKV